MGAAELTRFMFADAWKGQHTRWKRSIYYKAAVQLVDQLKRIRKAASLQAVADQAGGIVDINNQNSRVMRKLNKDRCHM